MWGVLAVVGASWVVARAEQDYVYEEYEDYEEGQDTGQAAPDFSSYPAVTIESESQDVTVHPGGSIRLLCQVTLELRSWRLLETPEDSWRLLETPGDSWRLLEIVVQPVTKLCRWTVCLPSCGETYCG